MLLFPHSIQQPTIPLYSTKWTRLETIESPKIILVGNSNLTFGMDSEKLEEALGMPVVNLGLHGGFGNRFHELLARQNISEGDIVIVCHSNYNDDNKMFTSSEFWYTMENHYDLWKIVTPLDLLENAISLPAYLIKATGKYITGTGNGVVKTVYARENFNEYGDIRSDAHHGSIYKVSPSTAIVLPTISNTCIKRLNRLNRYCADRGATMVIAGYPILDCEYTPNRDDYISFQKELELRTDCDVISDYTDYMYTVDYFYDTQFHLNDEGAKLRTQQLIDDLNSWQEKK